MRQDTSVGAAVKKISSVNIDRVRTENDGTDKVGI